MKQKILIGIFLFLIVAITVKYTCNPKETVIAPNFTQSVDNQTDKVIGAGSNDLSLMQIKNISFAKLNNDLYVKVSLASSLPSLAGALPSINNDQIGNIEFNIAFDENYFSADESKNPGGADSQLKIAFFGHSVQSKSKTQINVEGELVSGGPGYDFFVAKYSFNKIFFSPNDKIVFAASSTAYSANTSIQLATNTFTNTEKAATKGDDSEILIDLPR